MKILLVEDSRVERQRMGNYLTDWRLDFVAVGTGTEAINLLEGREPPNMVLLDWMLPDLDGIDICRRTRAHGARAPYVYIIRSNPLTPCRLHDCVMNDGVNSAR